MAAQGNASALALVVLALALVVAATASVQENEGAVVVIVYTVSSKRNACLRSIRGSRGRPSIQSDGLRVSNVFKPVLVRTSTEEIEMIATATVATGCSWRSRKMIFSPPDLGTAHVPPGAERGETRPATTFPKWRRKMK